MIRHDWTLRELEALYQLPMLELISKSSAIHQKYYRLGEVQICHLISVKTGGCIEDCKYCSQSSKNKTAVKPQAMLKREEVLKRSKRAKENGSSRICLGAAWRNIKDDLQFQRVIEMIKDICGMGLEVCCTLGMLSKDQAKKLKQAGLYAYNHNLDSSEEFYKTIVTTRTYQDRIETIQNVREANLTVCCGGIIGLGETYLDRLKLIQTLSSLNPHPESVPINQLIAIKGTPLAHRKKISVWELIRAIAISRIIMPRSMVRLSAGRDGMTIAEQGIAFLAGANSIFWGEKLLTAPNPSESDDQVLFDTLNLTPTQPYSEYAKAD